jgi:hypothetical protein
MAPERVEFFRWSRLCHCSFLGKQGMAKRAVDCVQKLLAVKRLDKKSKGTGLSEETFLTVSC